MRGMTVSPVPQMPLSLRRRWWLTTAVYFIGLLLAFLALRQTGWGAEHSWSWLAISTLTAVGILLFLRRHLADNHPPHSSRIYPMLGPANRITLARGFLLACLAGFLFAPWPLGWLAWAPVVLYVTAVTLDLFDGYAARLSGQTTRLGEILDVELDGLGIGLTILLAVWYGQLPWWFLSLAVARFLFVWSAQWRARRNLPVHDLPPSQYRRYWAGFQMGFLTVALWPIAPPSGVMLVGLVYLGPILAGFMRDWLVMSDRLDPTADWYMRGRKLVHQWFFGWGPLLARLAVPLLLSAWGVFAHGWAGPPAWSAVLLAWGVPFGAQICTFLVLLTAVSSLLLVLGIGARWAALALVFPIALLYIDQATVWKAVAAMLANYVVLAGSGYATLYRPAEKFLFTRLGNDS